MVPCSAGGAIIMSMSARRLFPALTKDELASLGWISVVTTRAVIPVAHIEKLLASGYVHESVTGLALTDLGVSRLEREKRRKD
jgi:hypothetical protein